MALLLLSAPPREYFPTPKQFICRIAAIICSVIYFLLKNRDKRLKSLNIFACMQIGKRKMTKRYFGTTVLFKAILDLML